MKALLSFTILQVHHHSGHDVPCSAPHHIQQRVQAEVPGPSVHNFPSHRTKVINSMYIIFEPILKEGFFTMVALRLFGKNKFSFQSFFPPGGFRYPRGPQPIPLPPPPPPPPLEKAETAESSVKRKSEYEEKLVAKVQKTEASGSEYCRFNQAWAETYDRPLPSELLSQCRPLMCDLCSVKLNSPVQAK